jgi:hypothetical protein
MRCAEVHNVLGTTACRRSGVAGLTGATHRTIAATIIGSATYDNLMTLNTRVVKTR